MRFVPLLSRRAVRRRTPSFRDWRRRRLACEHLEDRRLLATFLVTTAEDDGAGSLRQAIAAANAAPNSAQPDLISFEIAAATRSIPIGSTTALPLPPITDPVVIDGTTQDGFIGVPLVELDGTAAGSQANGLTIQSGRTTVRGLVINRFSQDGIRIEGAGDNRIEGNYVGTDLTGLVSRPNDRDGVSIFGSSGNVVGGKLASQRNLISGNDGSGVAIAAGTQSIDDIRSFGPPPLGPPYTGTFAPHEFLSAFNGQNPNGNWILNVRDQFLGADDGHVRAFSLIITNANNQATTYGYTGPPVAVPAADGSSINVPVTVSGFAGSIADLNFRIDGTSESDPGVDHTFVGDLVFALTSPSGTTITLINGSGGSGQNFLQTVLDDPTSVPGTNVVRGNFIGTDVTGTSPLSNRIHGVLIDGSPGNLIGGVQLGASNVISGNGFHGISIRGGTATGNQIVGNSIGAGVGGTLAIPNRFGGISIFDGSGNIVGGIQPGAGNTIAYNEDRGIHILSGKGNSLLGNAIFANRSLGIDLADEFDDFGVTPNDAGPPPDSDAGPNRLQNFPVLASARRVGNSTVVSGQLTSTPLTTFRIEFFANEIPDPSEHGEGEVFLGWKQVTTDAQGRAVFSANLPAVTAGKTIAATATDSEGNTSEFSAVVDVTPDSNALQFKVTNTSDAGPGSLRYAILSANAHRGVDRITFKIPGPGPHTIAPTFRLPTITDPVVIDATTEPDYSGTPVVELTGGGAEMNGLRITGGRSMVRGLIINSFQGAGILLESDSNRVHENYVGTDVTGTHERANGVGIKVMGQLNWIGTDGDGRQDATEGNLISGNLSNVWITQPGDEPAPSPAPAASGATNPEEAFGRNVVAGNFIGCDVTGQLPLGFGQDFGALIETGGNRVGTNGDGRSDRLERNLVLGSGSNVQLGRGERFFDGALVDGLRTEGQPPRPPANDGRGVRPTTLTAASVVSGFGFVSSAITLDGGNLVVGNIIGTDIQGLPSSDNFSLGIDIRSDGNLVAGNLVSNNQQGNVAIFGDENTVVANLIGTDLTGTMRANGSQFGVDVRGNRNVIGIGQGLPNRWSSQIRRLSILPSQSFLADGGNLISGIFDGSGVNVAGSENVVAGNRIGTDIQGKVPLPNAFGVTVHGDRNRIGTDGRPLPAPLKHNNSSLGKGNLISGNLTAGVIVLGHGTIDHDSLPPAAAATESAVHLAEQQNLVAGNWIGTDVTGRRPLGNGLESQDRVRAVPIVRVRAVTVCEIIDGQTICRTIEVQELSVEPFREIDDSSPEIGSPGILVAGNANQIGGPGALANTIAFNGGAGVAVEVGLELLGGAVAFTGNSIRGNSIHDNRGLGIDLGVDGVSVNDRRDADIGPNHLQNFPTIKSVQRGGNATRVMGSLHSQPNTTYTLDFYASPISDPSGFGEGSKWLGSTAVKTNDQGDATFNVALRTVTSQNSVVSATATDSAGNTSEFSFAPQGKVTARSTNGQLLITGVRNDDRAIRIAPGAAGLNSIEVTDGSETRSFTGITRGVFVSLPGRGNDALFFDGGGAPWQLSGKLEVSTGDGNDQALIVGLSARGRAEIDLGGGNDQLRVIDSVFAEDWQVHLRGGDDALDLWHVVAQKASGFDTGNGRDRIWIDALRGPAGSSGEFTGPVDIRTGADDDRVILGGFPDFGEDEVPLNEPLLFLDLLTVDGGAGYDRLEGRFLRAPSRRLLRLEDVFFADDPNPDPDP